MGVIRLIGNLIKALLFFGNIWKEKDDKKSEEKAKIGRDIIDAFRETDKKKRASLLNRAIDDTNSL